jgi:TonB family protein
MMLTCAELRGCRMSDSWKQCEGEVIDGRFRLIEHLGGSNHSVVFLTERGDGQPQKAAIKFVQADPANADRQLSRWKQAAQLSHPNLIKLFENGRCHLAGMDLLYVVMEFAAENLAEFLPQRALSPAETRDMLEPFLETLTYLHAKGMLHGRIKPGNILAIDDQLKLSSDSVCRIAEAPLGTKADVYTPPEASEGENSPAGDVWALGITVVETLTQRTPERTGLPADAEGLSVPDSVPQPFLDIVRHCLLADPRRRWSVSEISTRLNAPAKPPAPSVSATTVPDPIRPTPPRAASPPPGVAVAAPAQSGARIDPLSVPLSPVPPPLPPRKHALESQTIVRKSGASASYYVVVVLLIALTVGALLAIPRLRNQSTEPATTSAPIQPAMQPSAPVVPAKSEPSEPTPTPTTPQAKPQKSVAPPAVKPEQRSALQPPQQPTQDLLQTTASREYVKKDQPLSIPGGSMAASSSGPSARDVTPGEVLNQVLPEVSQRSRNTIHGTVRVVVKVHVDSTGAVTGADLAAAPSRFFGEAALQAARRWDFAPAKVGTQYVASEWLVRFDFTQANIKILPSQTRP